MTTKSGEERTGLAFPVDVAEYFGVSLETLRTWRKKRRGPRPLHVGRLVRYDWKDVYAYVEELKESESTWAEQKERWAVRRGHY